MHALHKGGLGLEVGVVHGEEALGGLGPLGQQLDGRLHFEREDDAHAQEADVGLVEDGGDVADGDADEEVEEDDDDEDEEEEENEPVEREELLAHCEVVVDVEVAEGHAKGFDQHVREVDFIVVGLTGKRRI